jgi:hypothetical protein
MASLEAMMKKNSINIDSTYDLGGYQWLPTFSGWLKTIFWQFWQFTIFSSF